MNNNLTNYDQEVLSALYKVSGYLAEQHEPEQGQDRSKEIDTVNLIIERVEAKNKVEEVEEVEEDDSWMDFNSTMSPCHY